MIDLYLIRIEGIESLRSAQIHPAVGSQKVGIRQELVAGETVVTVEQQRRFAQNPLDETLVRREPHLILIDDDGCKILTRRIDGDTAEGIGGWLILAQSHIRSHEKSSLGILLHAVYLIAADRGGILRIIQILLPGLVSPVAPESLSLGSKPDVALLVFLDVDGKAAKLFHQSESLLLLIQQAST